jgi:hypothetical protein
LKPPRRLIFLLALPMAFSLLAALPAAAQDGGPSLGDIARQERARRMAETDATEIDGLKPAEFHANILLADSKTAIEKWVLLPAAERPNAGRIRQATRDKKIYVPFVVSEYPYPASEKMDLVAHIRFISPAGKVLLESPKFSENVGVDPRSPHTIVLNPVMDMTFDARDVPGAYTLRLTIMDRVHNTYARAEEKIELVQDKVETGDKGETPAVVPTSEAH